MIIDDIVEKEVMFLSIGAIFYSLITQSDGLRLNFRKYGWIVRIYNYRRIWMAMIIMIRMMGIVRMGIYTNSVSFCWSVVLPDIYTKPPYVPCYFILYFIDIHLCF